MNENGNELMPNVDADHGKHVHVTGNSGNMEWITPKYIIDAARQVMSEIDFDPASSTTGNRIVAANSFCTLEYDGLKADWFGRVWMNPPYKRGLIDKFVQKLVSEYSVGHVDEAIVLTNNATCTQWFHNLAIIADAFCWHRGRIEYLNRQLKKEHKPLQGQVLTYIGSRPHVFARVFQQYGLITYPAITSAAGVISPWQHSQQSEPDWLKTVKQLNQKQEGEFPPPIKPNPETQGTLKRGGF